MCIKGCLTYNPLKNTKIIITDGTWVKDFSDEITIKIIGSEF